MPCRTTGALRIIGGDWRGRKFNFIRRPSLRPSGDRVRESLFNCLGQRLDGLRCLDLFAGSGALGLEAASRGRRCRNFGGKKPPLSPVYPRSGDFSGCYASTGVDD